MLLTRVRIALFGLTIGRTVSAVLQEVCHAPTARDVLDLNFDMTYFLPCKVIIKSYPEKDGEPSKTEICLLKPTAIGKMFSGLDPKLLQIMESVEATMVSAISEAA